MIKKQTILPEYFEGTTSTGHDITFWPTHEKLKIHLNGGNYGEFRADFDLDTADALIEAIKEAVEQVKALGNQP